MAKSTRKGSQYEGEVKHILQADGWHVEGQHRKVMFLGPGKMVMAGRDIYGCDLIAKKLGEKPLWIQVSTVDNKSKKEKQVREFPWNLQYETLELWLRVSGKKEYRVFRALTASEYKEVTHEKTDKTIDFVEDEPRSVSSGTRAS